MRYTIYFTPKDIGRGLNMADIRKSDTLRAGMLEQVLDDLICWHDIKARDLDRVMDYIQLEFGRVLIQIEEEYHRGRMVEGMPVCAVQLGGHLRTEIFELWDAPHENWPKVGERFKVGRLCGKCIDARIDPENTSAIFEMEVESDF